VVEPLLVGHRETGRFLIVKRTAGLPFMPGLLQLGGAHDQAGQRGPRAEFIQPLR